MKKSRLLGAASICLLVLSATSANASVVQFSGNPATTFADGFFSVNIDGTGCPDGFYATSSTSANNGCGMSGLYIQFSAPVTLTSLQLRDDPNTDPLYLPDTITAVLYGGNDSTYLTEQTVDPTDAYQTLVFNTPDVTRLYFVFTGGAFNLYGDGRYAAWYEVNNITYTSAVPLPAAAWLMGSGLIGLAGMARRKKSK